jgi:hypothetical protein
MTIYAGIGSRETPDNILKIMTQCAVLLAHDGFICSTGGAIGADQAFAQGSNVAGGTTHLHLPWKSYEEEWVNSLEGDNRLYVLAKHDVDAYHSVETYHPSYDKIQDKRGVIALHARNYNIITKPERVKFIICWTKDAEYSGGTAQAMRIADDLDIPIYNLGNIDTLFAFKKQIKNRYNEIERYGNSLW